MSNQKQLMAMQLYGQAKKLHEAEMYKEAYPLYKKAISLMPKNIAMLVDFGKFALDVKDYSSAEDIFRKLRPHSELAKVYYAETLYKLEKYEESLDAYKALKNTNQAVIQENIGVCYMHLQKYQDAVKHLKKSIELEDNSHRQGVLAKNYIFLRDYKNADKCFQKICARRDNDTALNDAGVFYLSRRDFAKGFELYENRFAIGKAFQRPLDYPRWNGEPLEDDRYLLVWGEQGIGDELLMAGLLRKLPNIQKRFVVEIDRRLIPSLERSFPDIKFFPREKEPVKEMLAYDIAAQISIMSMASYLIESEKDVDGSSWIVPDRARSEAIRKEYDQINPGNKLIGISWRSFRKDMADLKSFPLELWREVLQMPGITWVNLQYGDPDEIGEELADFENETGIRIHQDDIDNTNDIDALMAKIDAMDLVVSVSNSTVVFAGSIGKECWNLFMEHGYMWVWELEGERVPWYESVRVIRSHDQDKEKVMRKVARSMAEKFSIGF